MWMQLRPIPEVGLGQQPPRKAALPRGRCPSRTRKAWHNRGEGSAATQGGQIHMPQPLAATVVACLATSTLPLFMRASA